jgi:hypothetical protein
VQNMKNGLDDLGTAENESGSANMRSGPDTLDTIENEFGSAKYKNWTRRP